MIAITENAQGCILHVRAQAGARKNAVVGEHAGAMKVAVTAPAQDGRANKALADLLCEVLELRRTQIELLSGQTSREKRFLILGAKKPELEKRLAGLLSD